MCGSWSGGREEGEGEKTEAVSFKSAHETQFDTKKKQEEEEEEEEEDWSKSRHTGWVRSAMVCVNAAATTTKSNTPCTHMYTHVHTRTHMYTHVHTCTHRSMQAIFSDERVVLCAC